METIFILFYKSDPCDLDLSPSEPNRINRGIVLTKTNQHVKYESPVTNNFQDNDWKLFGLPINPPTNIPLEKQYSFKGGKINRLCIIIFSATWPRKLIV